jgi:fucose 4-O-acetylase-like acetyltransferase
MKPAGEPRNTNIDMIKGGAIMLVILGHAIQCHVAQFDNNLLFRVIYSFHMPLFMILSGWFAAPGKPGRLQTTAIRLVLPVFAWYFIYYVATGQYRTISLLELAARWIRSPDVGLWFLWILFLCHLWLTLVKRWVDRFGLPAYLLGILVLWAVPFSTFGVYMAKYYFPFFAAGYVISGSWRRLARYSRFAAAVAALVFPFALQYWHRVFSGVSPVPVLAPVFVAGHPLDLSFLLFAAVREACALSGSILFAYFMTVLAGGVLRPLFAWLGAQTLEIYAIHQAVIGFSLGQGNVAVITSLVIATTTSLCAIWVIRRSAWASLILFGRREAALSNFRAACLPATVRLRNPEWAE